ncbi:MAG: UDP-N-acetylmuramoyl-L-alanyl-D-glutamate--2,6-diaminopimelate ligase [Bacteroidetes bacterium]|nr:MAG: UDP-N-acetylmuramoyl-L-alanyl-D-glutamate--2,6-diaminopimelate ligase [Bacteroidota bacterium]
MKGLKDILQGISYRGQIDNEKSYGQLIFDSREAGPESIFFAIPGSVVDGHQFRKQVVEAGCEVIVCEHEDPSLNVTQIVVDSSSEALALAAANFYDHPSKKLKLVGTTGTNGKTTISTLLFTMFRNLGYQCGLLSTVVNRINEEEIHATHTTPDPVSLNKLLAQMLNAGCTHCFMEVSSHAIQQHRVSGLHFVGGVFTNITHDHLDYHGTFANYIKAKKAFFDHLSPDSFALTNRDDKNGEVMLQNTRAEKYSYALKSTADFRAKVLENQFSGLVLSIDQQEIWTRLIGDFNAYNLLAVYGVARLLGEDKIEVLTQISQLQSVDGRFEFFNSDSGITAIVDYAHTPDALQNVLKTISNIRSKNEQVITVVGCGGDRDKSKRPKMAAISCDYSDQVILTSDNPRSEDPNVIINEMQEGVTPENFRKVLSITDRSQAIKTACSLAHTGDIILVAGKGHENYQEIKGVKHHFDDLEELKKIFQLLQK